jgi:FkbM family methyltransferase
MSARWSDAGVICVNAALGEHNEEMNFNVYDGSVTDSLLQSSAGVDDVNPQLMKLRKTVKVPVMRLDDLLEERGLADKTIDLLKIDVQGFEDRVLRGAMQALDRAQYALVEVNLNPVYKESCLVDQVCHLLYGKGFRLQKALGMLMAEKVYRPISSDFLFRKI